MLSNLLLLLLQHWWPRSGCTLCIVHYYCTLTLTLTRRQPSALVALSFAFINDFVLRFHSVHSIGYNFHSIFFSLAILLRNQQLLLKFILSVGSKQRATTTLDSEHVTRCSYFFVVLLSSFQPHFNFGYFNLVCSYIFVCVTFQPLFDFCSVPNLPHLRQFVHSFALQWLPILILLGTSAHQTFGLCQLFPNLQKGLVTIWPPLSLQQQLLRFNFVPRMRRNSTFGSASSRPSLQRQESNHKNPNMPTTLPACPSTSFETFWILLMPVTTDVRFFERYFAWTVWKEQVAVLLRIALPSHGNAGP